MTRRIAPRAATKSGLTLGLLLAALALMPSACGGDAPEARAVRTAKGFITAARTDNTKALLPLLESGAVTELERAAAQASEHVGGRRTIEAHEMLQIVDVDPLFQVERVQVVDLDARLAVVEVTSTSGEKVNLTLVDEDGQWKVRVPSPGDGRGGAVPSMMMTPP